MRRAEWVVGIMLFTLLGVLLAGCGSLSRTSPGLEAGARTSAATGKIAFCHRGDVWVMNGDGSGAVQLRTTTAPEYDPAWSPDGTKIAFIRRQGSVWNLFTMNARGRQVQPVTAAGNHPSPDSALGWSPDGTRIAFAGTSKFAGYIYIVQLGGPLTCLSITGGEDIDCRDAAWSPDGSKIIFERHSIGLGGGTWVVMADGTSAGQLGHLYGQEAHWKPDGKRIVLSRYKGGNYDIYRANADGSGVKQLTTDTAIDVCPCWSPNGAKIAFASNRSGTYRIYTMKADGTGVLELAGSGAGDDTWPDWR